MATGVAFEPTLESDWPKCTPPHGNTANRPEVALELEESQDNVRNTADATHTIDCWMIAFTLSVRSTTEDSDGSGAVT